MRLLIAAGGTGGHVFPAIAVADEAVKRGHDVTLALGGLKTKIPKGFPKLKTIRLRAGRNPLDLIPGVAQSLFLLSEFEDPNQVRLLATGSYAAFPLLVAAVLRGVKFVLLEQNRLPGRVVRLFAPFAKAVCSTFPNLGLKNEMWTGNPTLRRKVSPKDAAKANLGIKPEQFVVFVVGGSLGALKLAKTAYEAAKILKDAVFIIQTGGRFSADVLPNVRLFDFIDEMELFYSAADLMVSRAGGGAIAEASIFRIPLVLIPYPFAADKHQHKNAEYIASIGGAIVIDQNELTPERLAETIRNLMSNPSKLEEMSVALSRFARPDAAKRVIEIIERI